MFKFINRYIINKPNDAYDNSIKKDELEKILKTEILEFLIIFGNENINDHIYNYTYNHIYNKYIDKCLDILVNPFVSVLFINNLIDNYRYKLKLNIDEIHLKFIIENIKNVEKLLDLCYLVYDKFDIIITRYQINKIFNDRMKLSFEKILNNRMSISFEKILKTTNRSYISEDNILFNDFLCYYTKVDELLDKLETVNIHNFDEFKEDVMDDPVLIQCWNNIFVDIPHSFKDKVNCDQFLYENIYREIIENRKQHEYENILLGLN